VYQDVVGGKVVNVLDGEIIDRLDTCRFNGYDSFPIETQSALCFLET
jgi:hypothetical protein